MESDNNRQLKYNIIYKPRKPHLSEELYDNNVSNDLPKNYSIENFEEVMNTNNNNNGKNFNEEEEYLEAQIQNNQNNYEYENNYHDNNEDINMNSDQNNFNYENENNEEINHIQNNSNEYSHEEDDDIKGNYENNENVNSSQNNNQNLYDSEENNDIDEDTIHNQNIHNNNNINLNNNQDKNNNNEENIDVIRSDNIYQENENENKMNEQNNNEKYNLPLSINSITKDKKYNIQEENEITNEINLNSKMNDQNKVDYIENKNEEGNIYNNNFNLTENTDLKKSDNESNNNTNNINKITNTNINYKELTIKISDGIKFGIDMSGNPVDISRFDENKDNNNKIIAFIIEKENENNYLIDIKGNVLKKEDDDYYCYKEGEEFIIIKDFDVQHPELRVYGHRKINFNEMQNKNNEEIKEESNFDKYKDNNVLIDNNIENIKDYETNCASQISNINKKEKDKNNINLNKNIDEMILNNIKNKADIIKENNNDKKVNPSTYLKTAENNNNKIINEFKSQMVIWRHRYGKKNEFKNISNIINKSDYRNHSYNDNSTDDKMINRTGSILNIASERINFNKQSDKSRKIPISLKNNKYIYNKNILTGTRQFDGIKNPLIKNKNISFTKNTNNPLLSHFKRRNILIKENIHAFKRLNLNRDEKNKIQRIPRNLTLENFNIKHNNINKNANSNYKKNLELYEVNYQIKDDIMKNIRNKNNKNSFHLINRSENFNNMDISYDTKKQDINNYIHYNLTKMNENKFRKKNLSIKYSILSNEANQLIKNFTRKQTETRRNMNISIEPIEGFSKYSERDINYNNYMKNKNKRNALIKDSYSYYDKNPNLYFNYENENENEITDSDDSKIRILPNKLQKHKISILNSNFFKGGIERQNKNIGDFYQRMIKYNTSYDNYKNI